MLKQIIFLKREKLKIYFRQINSEYIYIKYIENEEIMNLKLGGFMGYLLPMNLVLRWRKETEELFHPYKLM